MTEDELIANLAKVKRATPLYNGHHPDSLPPGGSIDFGTAMGLVCPRCGKLEPTNGAPEPTRLEYLKARNDEWSIAPWHAYFRHERRDVYSLDEDGIIVSTSLDGEGWDE